MSSSDTIFFIVILSSSYRGDAFNKCFIAITLIGTILKKRQHFWEINGPELSCKYELCPSHLQYF